MCQPLREAPGALLHCAYDTIKVRHKAAGKGKGSDEHDPCCAWDALLVQHLVPGLALGSDVIEEFAVALRLHPIEQRFDRRSHRAEDAERSRRPAATSGSRPSVTAGLAGGRLVTTRDVPASRIRASDAVARSHPPELIVFGFLCRCAPVFKFLLSGKSASQLSHACGLTRGPKVRPGVSWLLSSPRPRHFGKTEPGTPGTNTSGPRSPARKGSPAFALPPRPLPLAAWARR